MRRKNANRAMNIGDKAIAPLLGGLAGDGSSVLCTLPAISLMTELRYEQEILRGEKIQQAVAQDLREKGFDVEFSLEFELALLKDLPASPELIASLTDERCISRGVCLKGFATVEEESKLPIAVG